MRSYTSRDIFPDCMGETKRKYFEEDRGTICLRYFSTRQYPQCRESKELLGPKFYNLPRIPCTGCKILNLLVL